MAPSITFHIDPDETAEAFVMGRMDAAELAAYREHLERCQSCATTVEEQRIFIEAMRGAMRELAAKRAKNRSAAE